MNPETDKGVNFGRDLGQFISSGFILLYGLASNNLLVFGVGAWIHIWRGLDLDLLNNE